MSQVIKMSSRSLALALRCTACGAEANAACECGANYEPASVAAARALKSDPGKSNRALAALVGVDEGTVRKLRNSTAEFSAVERTVGQDGKARPAVRPSKPKPEVIVLEPLDYTFHMFTLHVLPWFEQLSRDGKTEFLKMVRKEVGYDF
jgi:hypothetical protein